MINLISNAIKFTDRGYVEIDLSNTKDKILFAIKDTGIGISSDQKEAIFGSFKQGDNISKGKHGGTGLGLAISKQLIELQNGTIWVESEKDKGSTFFFELPLVLGELAQETNVTFTEDQLKVLGKELEGLHILLAEDNEFNIMVVKDDLEWYIPKVNLTIVSNGKLALEQLEENSFDAILMDVQMPEMNGYDATRIIRESEMKNKEDKAIPIIAMTASLLKNQINKCFDAGMNAYIPKPYTSVELMTTLNEIIKENPGKT